MTGTAVGLTGREGRSTTTIMFTYPIRRSHQDAATILQDHRLQTARERLQTAREGWVGLVVWAVPAESAALAVSAGPGESADREGLAGQAVSGVQGESAGLGELAGVLDLALSAERVLPTGWEDHLLGHTIRLKPGRTRASTRTWQSRISPRQALFPTIQGSGARTEIWRRTSPYEMGMRQRSQPIGWPLTDPQPQIAPTIRCEGLAARLIPGADAMEHSVAINPVEELKPRATAGDPASAEAGEVAAVAVGVVEEAEVVAAVAVAVVVDDDASWRFEHVGNRKRLTWKR
jgi:hypothetical protein